jgi:hypothetical protein
MAQVDAAVVLEARRGDRVAPITLQYAAVRELRGLIESPHSPGTGLLLGQYSENAASIAHCVPEGNAPAPPIGLFRTQPGGWPVLTEADCIRVQSSIPHAAPGALFLIVRTPAERPWAATLFALDPRQPSPAEAPLLEFPFDEHLLRNGWVNDLTSPPGRQSSTRADSRMRPRKPWMALAAAAAIIGGGAAAYQYRFASLLAPERVDPASAIAPAPAAGLSLKVSRTADDLEISWDRSAPSLRNATAGTLRIRNGPVTRTIPVSGDQLREGKIMYRPLFGMDADFRLEVQTAGGKSLAESVQVLGLDAAAPWSPLPAVSQRKESPFGPTHSAPPPVERARTAAVTPRPVAVTPRPVTVPASHTEAVAIRRVEPRRTPEVLAEMKDAKGKVTISVLVRIDSTGRVSSAKVVGSTGEPSPSKSYLRLASLNAARQSRFRPATTGGKPQPSVSTLVFEF